MNYTLYQIHRDRLLRRKDGKPYSGRAAVSRVVRKHLKHRVEQGPHGLQTIVSRSEIDRWNTHA